MSESTFTITAPFVIPLLGDLQTLAGLPQIVAAVRPAISVQAHVHDPKRIVIKSESTQSEISFDLKTPKEYESPDAQANLPKFLARVLQKEGLRFNQGCRCWVYHPSFPTSNTSYRTVASLIWMQLFLRLAGKEDPYGHNAQALIEQYAVPGGFTVDEGALHTAVMGGLRWIQPGTPPNMEKLSDKLHPVLWVVPPNSQKVRSAINSGMQRIRLVLHKVLQSEAPDLNDISERAVKTMDDRLAPEEIKILRGAAIIRDLTDEARRLMSVFNWDHELLGKLFSDHHKVYDLLFEISTPEMNEIVEGALQSGALGARLSTLGGVFIYAPPAYEAIEKTLREAGFDVYRLKIDGNGLSVNEHT